MFHKHQIYDSGKYYLIETVIDGLYSILREKGKQVPYLFTTHFPLRQEFSIPFEPF